MTSLRTALSRSSNSPRNLVPATSAPMSSAMTLRFWRLSGTSPETIRWARPSTIAVLPTPGSPIRTGLFLVRRLRTWTTRRISASRPMTGSILPLRASSTRSRPYFSSAWYLSSGFWSVTRWPPRTFWSAWSMSFSVTPRAVEQVLGLALDLGQAEQEVLDRDVLVLHPVGLGLGRRRGPRLRSGPSVSLAAGDLRQGVQPLLGRPEDWAGLTPSWPGATGRPPGRGRAGPPAGASARAADARGPAPAPAARWTASWLLSVS